MNIIKELEEAIKNGPTFGQSFFQTGNFVINKHQSAGRSYRQVLMEINTRVTALKKAEVSVKRINAEINKLNKKLNNCSDIDEKTIIECDIEDKQIDLSNQEKLVNDSIAECNYLYEIFKQMPKMSHEEFEKEEQNYWKNRLLLDAELSVLASGKIDTGTAAALVQIGVNPLQAQTEIMINQQESMIQIAEQKRLAISSNEEVKEQKNA